MIKAIASEGKADIVITRKNGSDGIVTVDYKTYSMQAEDHNAVEEVDYVPDSGTLIFKKGETEKTIEIKIIEKEDGVERDETFGIELSNITPEGAKRSKKNK